MWLTTKDAAKELGVSIRTIRRRISNNEFQTKYEMIDTESNSTKILYLWLGWAECQDGLEQSAKLNPPKSNH